VLLAGFALFATAASAASQAPEVRAVDAEKGIEVSVRVENLHGDVLFDFQGEQSRVLASNTKLFTTAACLLEFPADFRWQTRAYLNERRLTIIGAGDPSIRQLPGRDVPAEFLDSLAAALREARLTKLDTIVLDDRVFDRVARHPMWPDEQRYAVYSAGVGGLSVEGGCLEVFLHKDAVRTVPPLGNEIEIQRRLRNDPKRVSAYWTKPDQVLRVNGGPVKPWSGRLAVDDPVQIFRAWLAAGLAQRGIQIDSVLIVAEDAPDLSGEVFWTFESAWTLGEAVAVANLDSDNFVSESLLKWLGAQKKGKGTFSAGIAAVRASLAEADLDLHGYKQHDGSGLARDSKGANLASPALLCELLRTMAALPEGQVYFDSLPVADVDSGLKRYFSDAVFAGHRVRAKTGWIIGASSLSGYALAPDGTPLVFSCVINYVKDNTPRTNNKRFRTLQATILRRLFEQWPSSETGSR